MEQPNVRFGRRGFAINQAVPGGGQAGAAPYFRAPAVKNRERNELLRAFGGQRLEGVVQPVAVGREGVWHFYHSGVAGRENAEDNLRFAPAAVRIGHRQRNVVNASRVRRERRGLAAVAAGERKAPFPARKTARPLDNYRHPDEARERIRQARRGRRQQRNLYANHAVAAVRADESLAIIAARRDDLIAKNGE